MPNQISDVDRLTYQLAVLKYERATFEQEILRLREAHATVVIENIRLHREQHQHDAKQAQQVLAELETAIKSRYGVHDITTDIDWNTGAIRGSDEAAGSAATPESPDHRGT